MKKIFCAGAFALALASCSNDKSNSGEVTIQLPADYQEKTLVVSHILLENSFTAKSQDDIVITYDTLDVKDGKTLLKLDSKGAAWYNIIPPVMTRIQPEFYAVPDDKLSVDIKSFEPASFTVTGSALMDDLTAYNEVMLPLQQEYVAYLNSSDTPDPAQGKEIMDRQDAAVKKFVAEHPESHALPMIIMDLSGDDFKALYDNLTPEAKSSIVMPFADMYNKDVEAMIAERDAEQQRKAEVASGTISAPDFTLPDLEGKKVNLSDFRGKWVVLDFWGSWCGWCIKGFPALKEAYEKYGDKIVVIGIDCNESEADWREGVKKHQIPWLNVYNGLGRKLYEEYKIEGFPTKAIINPEGKLVDLTTGEDPSFYDRLASFVKG